MRVLGIDWGSERTGFGVFESDGSRHRMLSCGVIRTSAHAPLAGRLLEISLELREVVRLYAPEAAAVEGAYLGALASVGSYRLDGARLVLLDTGGQAVLAFVR